MRGIILATAMAAAATAGAGAAVLDIRAPALGQSAPAQVVCAPTKFNIYFQRGQTDLSAPAVQMLDMIGGHVKGCAIGAVALDMAANEVASAEGRHVAGLRGAAILKALGARGINAETIVMTQSGDANEPASAMPPHVAIAIDAAKAPLSVDRATPGAGREV